MKTKIKLLTLIMAIAALFIVACGNDAVPAEQSSDDLTIAEEQPEIEDFPVIGEGETMFLFTMTDEDGTVNSWYVHTNQETVGAALLEAGLIEGDETAFGLMVTHVAGIRADFEEDGAWWAFHIDGEMAMEGVDAINIEEGVIYEFIHTPA